jgi:DNA-binding CsgD family transcriptional regulator
MNEKFIVRMQNSSEFDSLNTSNFLFSQLESINTDIQISYSSLNSPLKQKIIEYDDKTSSINSNNKSELAIPLAVLKNNSSLQSIVLYLHEIHLLNFAAIADLLNRDQRTIWSAYNQAKSKKMVVYSQFDNDFFIPLAVLSSRNFSVLESIVYYLKSNSNLSLAQIAQKLGKNYRTIWTVDRRAKLKLGMQNKNNFKNE